MTKFIKIKTLILIVYLGIGNEQILLIFIPMCPTLLK